MTPTRIKDLIHLFIGLGNIPQDKLTEEFRSSGQIFIIPTMDGLDRERIEYKLKMTKLRKMKYLSTIILAK